MPSATSLHLFFPAVLTLSLTAGCASYSDTMHAASSAAGDGVIQPRVVTERVQFDSDDPAIWIHPNDPSQSLIIGTDKEVDGGLYVFDLRGNIIPDKTVTGLQRPNNVDVAYGLQLGGRTVDIAAATERFNNQVRIFALPDMVPVDGGGIPVFEGEEMRDPMGIALYTRPADGTMFMIVGRKDGPRDGGYLWQYRLEDAGDGTVRATKVREFGLYSGTKEIEAIAVDNELGYVYYSDELLGIRKYHADPDAPEAERELAVFGTDGFARDREGVSIYKVSATTGYILVSDQQANSFRIFPREGTHVDPHRHDLIKTVRVAANESDGSEVTSVALHPDFPNGLFVAMSDDGTFHYYAWEDLAGGDLRVSVGTSTRSVQPQSE